MTETISQDQAAAHSHPALQVAIYVARVFVYSLVFYWLMIRAHSVSAGGGLYVLGIMWCPALAAVTTLKWNGRALSELGWGWGETKYQVLSWAIPLLYTAITYALVWCTGLGGFPNPEFVQHVASIMGPNMPSWVAMLLYVALTGSFQIGAQHGEHSGRRNRLARVHGSRTGEGILFHDGFDCERAGVAGVALSGTAFHRLQRRHTGAVRNPLLYRECGHSQLRMCMDAVEIGLVVDRRDSARQPQSVHPGNFHSLHPGHGPD